MWRRVVAAGVIGAGSVVAGASASSDEAPGDEPDPAVGAPTSTSDADDEGLPAEAPTEQPVPVRAALDRDLPEDLDVDALTRRWDDAIAGGEGKAALPLLLDLASAHRRDGRIDAALDACYLALSLEPDDIGLHLGLVELYDERGWAVLAAEKLELLDRLVGLDDGAGADRLAAAREARG